jgi:cyclopropane fatty-acyl-phospholipid synthase-like methyltransferase
MNNEQLPPETNALAEAAYDNVYDKYAQIAENEVWPRTIWLKKLLKLLPHHSSVLDIGCGSGVPADQMIAKEHILTGIDISKVQIELARKNVPSGTFIRADLSVVQFNESTFNAIVAFYTFEQVPRSTHAQIFRKIATWLKPGGYFLFSVEDADYDDAKGNWLGVPIFLSVYKPEYMKKLITEAGFEILESLIDKQIEGDHEVPYLWVLARNP